MYRSNLIFPLARPRDDPNTMLSSSQHDVEGIIASIIPSSYKPNILVLLFPPPQVSFSIDVHLLNNPSIISFSVMSPESSYSPYPFSHDFYSPNFCSHTYIPTSEDLKLRTVNESEHETFLFLAMEYLNQYIFFKFHPST